MDTVVLQQQCSSSNSAVPARCRRPRHILALHQHSADVAAETRYHVCSLPARQDQRDQDSWKSVCAFNKVGFQQHRTDCVRALFPRLTVRNPDAYIPSTFDAVDMCRILFLDPFFVAVHQFRIISLTEPTSPSHVRCVMCYTYYLVSADFVLYFNRPRDMCARAFALYLLLVVIFGVLSQWEYIL